MRREALKWLKTHAGGPYADDSSAAANIYAELERLRRIERTAKKVLSMHTAEGLDAALGELAETLKKGSRK